MIPYFLTIAASHEVSRRYVIITMVVQHWQGHKLMLELYRMLASFLSRLLGSKCCLIPKRNVLIDELETPNLK